jgi:hypothetical protein
MLSDKNKQHENLLEENLQGNHLVQKLQENQHQLLIHKQEKLINLDLKLLHQEK